MPIHTLVDLHQFLARALNRMLANFRSYLLDVLRDVSGLFVYLARISWHIRGQNNGTVLRRGWTAVQPVASKRGYIEEDPDSLINGEYLLAQRTFSAGPCSRRPILCSGKQPFRVINTKRVTCEKLAGDGRYIGMDRCAPQGRARSLSSGCVSKHIGQDARSLPEPSEGSSGMGPR